MADKNFLERMLSIVKYWECFIGNIHYALMTKALLVKPV